LVVAAFVAAAVVALFVAAAFVAAVLFFAGVVVVLDGAKVLGPFVMGDREW
jgi:hypothetical protein